MKLVTALMMREISKDDFLAANNITQIEKEVDGGLTKAYTNEDAHDLEIYIFLIFMYDLYDRKYVDLLNKLLLLDWHFQHENISILLQKISDTESLPYLYNAICTHPKYVLLDENCAFQKKCVRALYHIGKEKSINYLKELCKNKNSIISDIAQRQLKKCCDEIRDI